MIIMSNSLCSYLVSNGFQIYEQSTSDFFDDYYDRLISDNCEILFRRNKSFVSIDIRKRGHGGQDFDLALVKSLILNDPCLNRKTDIEDLEIFLRENLEEVLALFDKDNYKITEKQLIRMENMRARQMFPNAFKR